MTAARSTVTLRAALYLHFCTKLAEGVGFEPTVPGKGYNGFRDRPDRPLRHPSAQRPRHARR